MNRREAMAALMSLPATSQVTRAAVKPNDVIVLELNEPASLAIIQHLKTLLEEVWPNNKCIVLSDGMKLKIAGHVLE